MQIVVNEHENYFRFFKNGNIHTLSDRIPFKWNELMIWTSSSFIFLIWFLGIGVGIFVAILTLIGYTLYRFASWIYYTEVKINEKTGNIIQLKKILNRTHKTELIANKFDSKRFEYLKLTRSGKTKFVLNYQTHKNNELLILKNKADKELIEKYISKQIKIQL